jgi:ATP-dependent Clp protease protease subunit
MRKKVYLRSIVREPSRPEGIGIELFRLDADGANATDSELGEIGEIGDGTSTAIMRIYEEIGQDFWTGEGITAKGFADELTGLGDIKRLNIHINSLGGDAHTAQAIHSILSDHPAKKTSYIDGVCASAATIIACAADEVVARANTNYMIHDPWAMTVGNARDHDKAAEDLRAVTVPIVSVYKEQVKGKIDEDKIRSLMETETWMTADQAVSYGFADKVRGKGAAIARVSNSQILCSGQLMNFEKYHFRNFPQYPFKELQAKKETSKEKAETPVKEVVMSSVEQVDPTLLASIRAEAAQQERERLTALEAMQAPGMDEIISKARADGSTANQIAMSCYVKAREVLLQADRTQALVKDSAPAAAVKAGDAPLVKPPDKPDDKTRAAALVANAFKARKQSRLSSTTNGKAN